MDGNGKLLTIKEAAFLVGVNPTTLYKKIKRGQLTAVACQLQGVEIKKIKKADVIKLYNNNSNCRKLPANASQLPAVEFQLPSSAERKAEIKEVIEEFFNTKQTQLMKPLEDQTIFIAGELKNEIKHLRSEKEALLEENQILIEKMKALPGPVEEVKDNLENLQKVNKEQSEIIQQQKEHFQEEEKDYFATIGELKRQLEEERNKPWWKKIF